MFEILKIHKTIVKSLQAIKEFFFALFTANGIDFNEFSVSLFLTFNLWFNFSRVTIFPRLLESIALEKADVEPGEDHTLPPYDRIRKKLGDLAETFKTECGFDESAALALAKPAAGGKRKAESSDGAAKKPKAEGSSTPFSMS